MKHTRIIFAVGIAMLAADIHALTVPVAQDTFSGATGKVAPASGKGVVLAVNAKQMALMRFNLTDLTVLPVAIQPGNIQSATLRLYVVGAVLPANVTVHHITTDWQEKFTGAPVPLPIISALMVGTIPGADLRAKSYVSVDVTNAVAAALALGANGGDFGFALKTADPKAKITFASKEGAATGYGAELEIVANTAADANGNIVGNDANFSGTAASLNLVTNALNAGDGTFTGTLSVSTAFVVEPRPNNTVAQNIFIGAGAGAANTTGAENTYVGTSAGAAGTGAGMSGNSFFGYRAGAANTAPTNSFFGAYSGENTTTGAANSFFGYLAGQSNTTGQSNSFFGGLAGRNNTDGDDNSFFGSLAGNTTTSGEKNSFFGRQAGRFNTTGAQNTFIGASAGLANTTAGNNSFVGAFAGAANTTGADNTFTGTSAAGTNTTGTQNVAVGSSAGPNNTTGTNNTFIGAFSGNTNTVENGNTFIGRGATGTPGATNSTAIGFGAVVLTSNSVVLGSNCKVGIRNSAPNSSLTVSGSLSLPIRTDTGIFPALTEDDHMLVCTGTNASVVLPPVTGLYGRTYIVKNRTGGNITVGAANPLQSIDGAATLTIANNAAAHLITNGTVWFKAN